MSTRRSPATFRSQLAGVREQVVVTASGTSQSADEVSKSVTVIDRSEAGAAGRVRALTDAVDLAPAVRVQTLGGPGQEASIHIRGMRDIDTAVVVDGMRLRDAAVLHGDATGLIEDLLFVNPEPRRGVERRGIFALWDQRDRRRGEHRHR